MSDAGAAIAYLKENNIEAIEAGGVVMIPFANLNENPDEFYALISRVKSLFKDIGYEKSWQVDPHYWERHKSEEDTYQMR